MFSEVKEKILNDIEKYPGSKARDISNRLGLEKKEVNVFLYDELRDFCWQDSDYQWFLKGVKKEGELKKSFSRERSTSLANICKYYISCLAEESGANVSVFAKSNFNLDYKELESLPTSENDLNFIFNSPEVQEFLNKTRRDSSRSLYFGYPVFLSKIYSKKKNWEGFILSPIFLFSIEQQEEGGAINIDFNFPTINMEVLRRFTNAKGEELIKELLILEEELGINNEKDKPDLDELSRRLKDIRPEWFWYEDINLYNLSKDQKLSECEKEGIYNRGVVLITKERPNNYTKGLEYELNRLTKISEHEYRNTALGQWINRSIEKIDEKNLKPILEVFPMNLEQREAVEKALTQNLTVITGPPGTGKSQVVTNLLINAAWQKKKVLFASKNNKAVDVVEARINNLGTRPTLLRLGGSGSYQEQLVGHISNLLNVTVDENKRKQFEELKHEFEDTNNKLLKIDSQINDFIEQRNKIERLDKKIEEIKHNLSDNVFLNIKEMSLDDCEDIESFLENVKNVLNPREGNFLVKLGRILFRRNRYKEINFKLERLQEKIRKINISLPLEDLNSENYDNWQVFVEKLNKRIKETRQIKSYFIAVEEMKSDKSLEELTKKRLKLIQLMADKSSSLWKSWIDLQAGELSEEDRTLLSQYKTTLKMVTSPESTSQAVWKTYYIQSQRISHILSSWAVTSLSARGRIPFSSGIFDLVIFDESSQCDIASALPLLFRAKRAVVIGDPNQLSHISSVPKKQDERLLEKYNLLESFNDWAYSYNSLFDLAAGISKGEGVIDLRDHYRSHADIINFSNKVFYEGRLRVATKYDQLKCPHNERVGIRWINIEGEARSAKSGSGSFNEIEADAVIAELKRLSLQDYKGSIGVVSPFRAQVNLIRKKVHDDDELLAWLSVRDFLCETVHKFQGDEREIMIFSPVISKGMPIGSIKFLQRTGNLFNVAITRARAVLLVIGNFDSVLSSEVSYMEKFAHYVKDELGDSTDIVNQESDIGPEYPSVSNPERVSEWEHVLYRALYNAGLRPIPQYQEEMYQLDFAIFDGKRKLNIEVDGEHYHKDWTGELCYKDQIRNQRMFELGWDVQRFWVYEVRDDIENCVKKVKEWIAK